MVNLSIDPPPFGRTPSSGRGGQLWRFLVYPLLLAIGLAGGFVAGRRTAPKAPLAIQSAGPDAARPQASAAPVTGMAAPAPSAPSAAPVGAPPAGPAPSATSTEVAPDGAPAAAAASPSAPQGPLVRRISVVVRGPLEESVASALPAEEKAWAEQLTQVVNRILVWSMRVSRDARKGDQLEVLYELPAVQPSPIAAVGETGPAVKEPTVLALRYGSQKLGRLLTAYRFKREGAAFARYYTSEGVEVEEHLIESPITQYEQVTSLLRDGRRHKGVDFKTPVGTPVMAPFDGQILRRNWNFSVNGNCLEVVDAKTGRHAIFLHLEAVPKDMQPGRKVKKGEVVARSGNSGRSTAPHLHYQLETPDGRVLDPYAVLPTKKVALEGSAKVAFEAERSRLDPMLVAGR
jgi:murein DD-endopeptidase MepM/ murein hydrolase activator NlpD